MIIQVIDYGAFARILSGLDLQYSQELIVFRDVASGISGGCPCNREARIQLCLNIYRQIGGFLNDSTKSLIKQKLNAEQVLLSEGGAMFYSF